MRAPDSLRTERLSLRRPTMVDASAIFERYSSDAEVTRYVGWPRHVCLDDTRSYLAASESGWQRDGIGAYVIFAEGCLLGGTGLLSQSATHAETGYVLARDAWGRGFATEALRAMVALATQLGLEELQACCHPDHVRSRHVLEKGGFVLAGIDACGARFPQLPAAQPIAVCNYVCALARSGE